MDGNYGEESNMEKLQRDSQLFEVLCRDYTSVYFIDLKTREAEILKLADGANAYKVLEDLLNKKFNYAVLMRKYVAKYIAKKDRARFLNHFLPEPLIKELQYKDRVSLRYQSEPNDEGQRYFEVQAVRMQRDAFDYKILLGFRHIDELMAAEQTNAAKTEFLSQVAHDIRTPLNAILGFVEIAKNKLDDREQVEYALDKITSSGIFLSDLVNDVLDLSKIESGQLELHPEKMSLSDFFGKLNPLLSLQRHKKKLNIGYMQHDMQHDCVLADPVRLRQIFVNIISNAIKYTPSGGSVDIEVQEEAVQDAGKVRLLVDISDTGVGMSPEFMKHMYSRFSRATDIRVSHTNGHGLGLAIVKELVDLFGGTIEVESKLGVGTHFHIALELPYVEEEMPDVEEQHDDDADKCRGLHLLVAEDNKLNYEVASVLLSLRGIACERVENGADCVEKFVAAPPRTYDAILMDMQMPVMDGLAATEAIRSSQHPEAQTIPIIAMTANAFSDDIQKCLDAGMQAHLSKPLDMAKLLRTLARYR